MNRIFSRYFSYFKCFTEPGFQRLCRQHRSKILSLIPKIGHGKKNWVWIQMLDTILLPSYNLNFSSTPIKLLYVSMKTFRGENTFNVVCLISNFSAFIYIYIYFLLFKNLCIFSFFKSVFNNKQITKVNVEFYLRIYCTSTCSSI